MQKLSKWRNRSQGEKDKEENHIELFTHCIPSKLEKEEDGENIFAEQIIVEEDREKRKLLFVQKGKPNKKKEPKDKFRIFYSRPKV